MPANAWFTYRHYHPHEAEDPRAAFAAGRRIGHQEMLDASTEWMSMVPLLGELLEELVALREERAVERAVIASDVREPEPAF